MNIPITSGPWSSWVAIATDCEGHTARVNSRRGMAMNPIAMSRANPMYCTSPAINGINAISAITPMLVTNPISTVENASS